MIVFLEGILEIPATRFGLFAYPGAPYSLTLWAGKFYQFPIYENTFMNYNYLSIGLLRFYRDDKGESLAERGVSTMRLPDRTCGVEGTRVSVGLVRGCRRYIRQKL